MFKLFEKRKAEFDQKLKFEVATVGEGEDAAEIYWEGELTEGTEVFIMNGEEMVPAPEGSHTISGGDVAAGTVVTLDVDGVVTSIELPSEEEQAEEEKEEEMEKEETFTITAEDVQNINETFDMLQNEIVALRKEVAKFKKETEARVADAETKVENFGKAAPAPEKKKDKHSAPSNVRINPNYYRIKNK